MSKELKKMCRFLLRLPRLPIDYFSNPVAFNDKINQMEIILGRKKLLSYPTSFGINLSKICNQSCNFCYHDNMSIEQTGFIDESIFKKMKWLRFVHNIDLFAGNGESLLNPHFPAIAKTVREMAPHSQISTFTNGLALNGNNLDATLKYLNKVHISLNAITREKYNYVIKGGDFDLVMQNLEELSRRKHSGLTVELSMVYMKSTINELGLMIDYAANHGFEIVTACHYIRLVEEGHRLSEDESLSENKDTTKIQEVEEYAREKGIKLYFPQKLTPVKKCVQPWISAYITVDINGAPVLHTCCSGIHLNTYLNKSTYSDFKRAWNGKRMQLIRETVNLKDIDGSNNMCYLCKQLERTDKHWRIKLNKLSENREGIQLNPYDLPQVFPKELI